MNSNPYQTIFYLENDKLAYVGFEFLWRAGKKFNVPRVSRKYPLKNKDTPSILKAYPPLSWYTPLLFFVYNILYTRFAPNNNYYFYLRKEILWKISAFKSCFMDIYPYQTKNSFSSHVKFDMGFGFIWGSGAKIIPPPLITQKIVYIIKYILLYTKYIKLTNFVNNGRAFSFFYWLLYFLCFSVVKTWLFCDKRSYFLFIFLVFLYILG